MIVGAIASMALALRLAGFPNDGTTPVDSNTFYRINPKGEKQAYYLRIQTALSRAIVGDERDQLVEADVYASNKKTILQKIHFGPTTKEHLSDPGACADVLAEGVDQADFNFDGYIDFEGWLWEEGGSGGCPAIHFLFDSKTHRYVDSPQLDHLLSTGFDDQEKVVRSYSRGGGMYSDASTYRWSGNKLVLVSEVKRDRDAKGYYTEYSNFAVSGHPKVKRVYLSP
jgi:hypothetical protein